MRTVKNILDSKPNAFNSIEPTAMVIDALRLLSTVNLSYLIVQQDNEFKGIFGERDYSRNVILKGRSSDKTMVQEVMTTELPIVGLDDTVEQCMNVMNAHKTRYLLAYNEGKFAGVITIHDLLRQVISGKEEVFDHNLAKKLIDNEESGRIY